MTEISTLTLRSGHGVVGNVGPSGKTPHQVAIGLAESLAAKGVSHQGARCNIILEGESSFGSGSMLYLGGVALRVTMPCEPCSHGAKLAGVQTSRFREIERYLAIVVQGGTLGGGTAASIQLGVFPKVPEDFRARCAWALDYIPQGKVVTAPAFLDAIGAGAAYARTLPRWMAAAKAVGKPVHRVLTANLTAPSWCAEATAMLADEQVFDPRNTRFDLTQELWF